MLEAKSGERRDLGSGSAIAPGALIEVRDALWRVLKVDVTSTGRAAWTVVGVSAFVQDHEAVFLEDYEPSVQVLDPAETKLVEDSSAQHRAGLLYLESLLQDLPPPDDAIVIGHQAACDLLDFQLDPARQALAALRARILIADAVGLGKTLEAGILLSELIRRGRAKRILVVVVKSMLTQFQKELWTRFSIPLVRLDSEGLKRIQEQVPANHNPFHHFDQVIISVDTLKQSNAFRSHLEASRWDVIIIDEAHNVAERGTHSQRARLAKLLSTRSDALIMLSATPHDGKATSFASLMNMLDPTAIANPETYTPEEIRGLFIRRFKKDIKSQVSKEFPEREIHKLRTEASAAEEAAYETLAGLTLKKQGRQGGGGMLFKTLLEKSLFSSPAACLQSIDARIKRLGKDADTDTEADTDARHDLQALAELRRAVAGISAKDFSRYLRLLQELTDKTKGIRWSRKKDDRLVIFTERIETLKFLREQLPKAIGLDDDEVATLDGAMSDVDQQKVVEDFGQERSPLKVLIASDVASEGINLHFQSHRLIHFDVPWSLMVFQQRNGRVDRYGQEQTPEIYYLLTDTQHEKVRGDARILELLIDKEAEATKNIGDPAALMHAYDTEAEELLTATAIEQSQSPEAFAQSWGTPGTSFDPLEALLASASASAERPAAPAPKPMPSVMESSEAFLLAALQLHQERYPAQKLKVRRDKATKFIEFTAPEDLLRRCQRLPPEVRPGEDHLVRLTADKALMATHIRRARSAESAWPEVQYLWPLHPAVSWARDRMRSLFGRHEAPVLEVGTLAANEVVIIVSGLVPNRLGQPVLHRWYGAVFRGGKLDRLEPFDELLERTHLGHEPLTNTSRPAKGLQPLVPLAVKAVHERVVADRETAEAARSERLEERRRELRRLRVNQETQLEFRIEGLERRSEAQRAVRRTFEEFEAWVTQTLKTEPRPFLQVIAALRGGAR